jgi:hypothetical protein
MNKETELLIDMEVFKRVLRQTFGRDFDGFIFVALDSKNVRNGGKILVRGSKETVHKGLQELTKYFKEEKSFWGLDE